MLEFDLIKKHGHYFVKAVVHDQEALLLIDTGWSFSIISKRLVKPSDLRRFVQVGDKRQVTREAYLEPRIANYEFPFTFLTEERLTGKANADFDGILGDNFLKTFSIITMNPKTNKIRLYTESQMQGGMPVRRHWENMTLKVKILNQEGYFIIDTGFNRSLLCYGSIYHAIKKNYKLIGRTSIFNLERTTEPMEVFQVPDVQLGDLTIEAPILATKTEPDFGRIDNQPVFGLIGMEVLMNRGFALSYSSNKFQLGTEE
ncbi:MAG: hypothetical protein QM758_15520 [Armatimonas sp.]